jgi:flavin-dependent dehydrogenase
VYDLIVIGGGPAGSSAAITASRAGAQVLLLERSSFPRNKVCGEFVSPESLDLLCSLLGPRQRVLCEQALRIPRARLFIDGRVLETPVDSAAASIARLELDAALWEAAQLAGVQTRDQATVQAVEGDGPFSVTCSDDRFEGRSVMNASGRWSNLSTRAPENGNTPKWLGIKAHFYESAPPNAVDLYFFESGYCGVQPVRLPGDNGTTVNVCAMVRSDVARTLDGVFGRNDCLLERSKQWTPATEPVTTSPLIFRQPEPVQGNMLMVGDAAGFVDPFVGDGISLSLRSGELAARSLVPFLEGEIPLPLAAGAYQSAYERQFLPAFQTSSKVRRMLILPKAIRSLLLSVFQSAPALTGYFVRNTR